MSVSAYVCMSAPVFPGVDLVAQPLMFLLFPTPTQNT